MSSATGDPSADQLSTLQPDTLRAEMANIQHSILHLERSNVQMRAMLANAEEEGLDEEDKKELEKALEENVGVRQRKEAVHNKLAQSLADLLGVDATHFLLKPGDLIVPGAAPNEQHVQGAEGGAPQGAEPQDEIFL